MGLKLSAAPTELPITVAELQDHLRFTDDTHNTEIMGYLRAVTSRLDGAEGVLNRALVTQTWILTLDAFPTGAIRLPLPPAQSVTSVAYIDTAGDMQTLAASNYKFLNANVATRHGLIARAFGTTWPSTRAEGEAVTVTWVAGYGARNAVPHLTRHLILLLVADAFRQREPINVGNIVNEMPTIKALIDLATFIEVA